MTVETEEADKPICCIYDTPKHYAYYCSECAVWMTETYGLEVSQRYTIDELNDGTKFDCQGCHISFCEEG